jgi:hypothetical protein
MKMIEMMVGSRGMGDAKTMAEMLRRMGRRGDTMLAHITPEEAEMLMEAGGSGTINPMTGLPEFARRMNTYYGFEPETDTFRVPEPDFEPISPYSFRPDEPEVRLTPPDQVVSADVRPQREYANVDFANYLPRLSPESYALADLGQAPGISRTGFRELPQEDLTTRTARQATGPYMEDRARFPGAFGEGLPQLRTLADQTATQPAGEPSLAQRAERGLNELQDLLDRYPNLTRAGTAGASILAQALMFNQANQAMRRDIEATRAAAQPFRQAQTEAMGRATGEGLTAEQQQELEIQQARARQNLGERGTPTGSAAAGILAAQQRRARSLARQESFGEALRLANIADQYDRRALEMELQRDQQLAQLFAGILGREVQQAQRTQAPAPAATGR